MALVQTIQQIPDTFEDLAFRIVKAIPASYKGVDIVSDSYHKNSIKSGEREKRGSSEKVIVKSSQSKVQREFGKFFSNNENKQNMIEILFEVIVEKRSKMLNLLRTSTLVLSGDEVCKIITVAGVENFTELISTQEEADTKIILHSHQALVNCKNNHVLLRSPTADTVILVLAIALLHELKEKVMIDNGTGNS